MKGIYKITNPEGKVYIGKSNNIEKRFTTYKRLDCKGQYLLFFSLAKYGWVNHTFEILEECPSKLLKEKENSYIEKYNCVIEGLNSRGQGIYSSDTEWEYPLNARKIKSKIMKEKWASGEFKTKWSKKVKDHTTGETYSTMSECSTKNKISHSKLLRLLREGYLFSIIPPKC